ncbi:MAG TPA: hypothetical protein PK765_01460 [bacterium]|nr:hypothetical protein [bacterium]
MEPRQQPQTLDAERSAEAAKATSEAVTESQTRTEERLDAAADKEMKSREAINALKDKVASHPRLSETERSRLVHALETILTGGNEIPTSFHKLQQAISKADPQAGRDAQKIVGDVAGTYSKLNNAYAVQAERENGLSKDPRIRAMQESLYQSCGIDPDVSKNSTPQKCARGLIDGFATQNLELLTQIFESDGRVLLDIGEYIIMNPLEFAKAGIEGIATAMSQIDSKDAYKIGLGLAAITGVVGIVKNAIKKGVVTAAKESMKDTEHGKVGAETPHVKPTAANDNVRPAANDNVKPHEQQQHQQERADGTNGGAT